MSEQLYKKCATCGTFYPGTIGDIHDRCPKHAARFEYTILKIKRNRSLSPEVYDVYWKDESGYHRACRGCGKHLLKKNGKPVSLNYAWRWCSDACMKSLPSPNWGQTAAAFLDIKKIQGKYPNVTIQCERCGEWFRYDKAEIHHIVPVSTLTEANIKMIWDYSNLMVLCHDCHNGDMHQDVYQAKHTEHEAWRAKQEIKHQQEFKKQWKTFW